jgi:four helix bundle protein
MGHLTGWGEGMNNPEVTMHNAQQPTGFDALDKAISAAGIAISLVMRVPAPLKPIADQVIRSASSVPANIAEGAGRSGRDRLHHYRIAYGSAKEVDIHLRLLIGAGALDNTRAATALQLFDDVRAITWRLLHPSVSR